MKNLKLHMWPMFVAGLLFLADNPALESPGLGEIISTPLGILPKRRRIHIHPESLKQGCLIFWLFLCFSLEHDELQYIDFLIYVNSFVYILAWEPNKFSLNVCRIW